MSRMRKQISVSGLVISALFFMNAVILDAANNQGKEYYLTLLVSIPVLILAIWIYYGKEDVDHSV